ncbi:hypothetical protein FQN50_002653 [Emmonsiellopsis sp. PD_5]|nr:hypothetical protein FQN50_002653 [Emmonsiellopsis sp. PD_5]
MASDQPPIYTRNPLPGHRSDAISFPSNNNSSQRNRDDRVDGPIEAPSYPPWVDNRVDRYDGPGPANLTGTEPTNSRTVDCNNTGPSTDERPRTEIIPPIPSAPPPDGAAIQPYGPAPPPHGYAPPPAATAIQPYDYAPPPDATATQPYAAVPAPAHCPHGHTCRYDYQRTWRERIASFFGLDGSWAPEQRRRRYRSIRNNLYFVRYPEGGRRDVPTIGRTRTGEETLYGNESVRGSEHHALGCYVSLSQDEVHNISMQTGLDYHTLLDFARAGYISRGRGSQAIMIIPGSPPDFDEYINHRLTRYNRRIRDREGWLS